MKTAAWTPQFVQSVIRWWLRSKQPRRQLLLAALCAGPMTLGPHEAQAQSGTEFNGSYKGTYNGTAQLNDGTSTPVNGSVAFSVTNGNITVTSPGSGSGTVDSNGSASFSGSGAGDGASYGFTGTFSISGSASASGSWTATFPGGTASGTWNASSIGLVGNVSTRLPVGTDENVLIEGFIVLGPDGSSKKLIVRAIGPSLIPFGIPDALANPTLEIKDANNTTVATNNDWRTTQQSILITGDQSSEISASGLAPSDDLESAIIANLAPGSYTAIVRGAGNTIGTGVVDAYDLSASSPARLANIATRGLIQPGDKLMIAGLIIQNGPVNAVVRAIGPSLAGFGIADALSDTTLELRNQSGEIVAKNDNWKSSQQQELEATGLQPTHDLEAALLHAIPPGQYTAQVRGQGDESGIGVVEIYFLE